MPRKPLFLMVFLFVFLSSCSNSNKKIASNKQNRITTVHHAKPSYPKDAIPFSIVDNRMILKMFMNDSVPINLLFDSGFGWGGAENPVRLTLSSAFVKKNLLGKIHMVTHKGMKIVVTSVFGRSVYFDYAHGPVILSGGKLKMRIKGFEIYNDTLFMSDPNHDGIFNLMGLNTVKENILEINFKHNYLRIISRNKFRAPKGYMKIKMRLVSADKILFSNIPSYLLGCNGDTINLSGDYVFDTGNPNGLLFTGRKKRFRNFMSYLNSNCSASKIDYDSYIYGRIFSHSVYKLKGYSVFGANQFVNGDIYIYKTNEFPFGESLWDCDLPINIIKNFNYFFDLKNKVVYVKEIHVKKSTHNFPVWGFHINKPKYVVRLVRKNSIIDKAGILCGDTILSINNYPLSHYNCDSIRYLKLKGTNLVVKYKTRRSDDTLSTVIHLQ